MSRVPGDQIGEKKVKAVLLSLGVSLLAAAAFVLFLRWGGVSIPWRKVLSILRHKLFFVPLPGNISGGEVSIIWNIRATRMIVAFLVGAGLAASGAVFQALLMNPLADSYTTGISSGAGFGASLALFINIFFRAFQLPVLPFAFGGALLSLFLLLLLSGFRGRFNVLNMIIAGIIVSAILSAGISLLKSLSGEKVSALLFWLMGNLNSKDWKDVLIALLIIPGIIALSLQGNRLNLLSLGEREAQSLGINPRFSRAFLLILASLVTAVCVSLTGIIGFIGLIIPHLVRFLLGADNRTLIPLSSLCGGFILLLADSLLRLAGLTEIPVGVFTTLVGGPFFIFIFLKYTRRLV